MQFLRFKDPFPACRGDKQLRHLAVRREEQLPSSEQTCLNSILLQECDPLPIHSCSRQTQAQVHTPCTRKHCSRFSFSISALSINLDFIKEEKKKKSFLI